jgi:uncharacterized protein (TIGR00304 family)
MNKYHVLSLICLIVGMVFFAQGILSGEIETGIAVVFPFIVGSGIYAMLGFIFVFLAILLFIVGFTQMAGGTSDFRVEDDDLAPQKKSSVKGGGVILIGPIPIVFGSNWKIAVILMIVAILLIITAVVAFNYL